MPSRKNQQRVTHQKETVEQHSVGERRDFGRRDASRRAIERATTARGAECVSTESASRHKWHGLLIVRGRRMGSGRGRRRRGVAQRLGRRRKGGRARSEGGFRHWRWRRRRMWARWVSGGGKVAHCRWRRLLLWSGCGCGERFTIRDGGRNCSVTKYDCTSAIRFAKQGRLRDRRRAHFVNARDGRVLRLRAARHAAKTEARARAMGRGQILRGKRFAKHGRNRRADRGRPAAVSNADADAATAIGRR